MLFIEQAKVHLYSGELPTLGRNAKQSEGRAKLDEVSNTNVTAYIVVMWSRCRIWEDCISNKPALQK